MTKNIGRNVALWLKYMGHLRKRVSQKTPFSDYAYLKNRLSQKMPIYVYLLNVNEYLINGKKET